VGLAVKHQQLAHQVGVIIDDPLENSMATFNFTNAVLDKGTTFVFCVADGAGSFRRHLVDDIKPKASAASQRSGLDEFIDNLDEMLLPDLAREFQEESVFYATSIHATLGLLRSNLIRSEDLHTRLLFGPCNTTTLYQKAM
jgi:hypothetical protein